LAAPSLGHAIVVYTGVFLWQFIAQLTQETTGSFKHIEKKVGKCVQKCSIVIMALHIAATMFPKPHFICHEEPIHTKIAYKICILKFGLLQFKPPK
jgi:ABC-type polysaccharide/polyol phosphate export permease